MYNARTAHTWPEALEKQAMLLAAEARPNDPNDEISLYFQRGAAACRQALKLWGEEEQRVTGQMAELRRQMAELRNGIRYAVADRLEVLMPNNEGTAAALRNMAEDEADLSEWLEW